MNNKRVIGFMGKAGSGKDYITTRILSESSDFKRFALADHLKDICSKVFDLDLNYMHDPKLKALPFPTPINCGEYHAKLENATGLTIPIELTAGVMFRTPRELLQQVGTDIIRSVQDNYWLSAAKRQIKAMDCNVLITDIRFPNEFHMVKAMGGVMVHIIRPSLGKAKDPHPSETALATFDADIAVVNFESNPMPVRLFVRDTIADTYMGKSIYT